MRDKIAPIAIALAAAVLGTFAMLGLDEIDVSAPKTPVAEATHYWEDEQTETDSIDWCMAYDLPSEWQSAYTFSAARWNASPSDWTLVLDSCNFFTGRMSFSQQQWLPDDPGATYTARSGGLVLGGWSALNTDYDWDIYPWEGYDMCDPDCDIITVMVHEMGHWVRFVHGGCNSSVMCAQFITKWFVTGHDSDSLVDIYGP